MFQFTGSPPYTYFIQYTVTESSSARSPHSDICGSSLICSSPQLFAACHVFHRLLVPGHPSCALLCLTFMLIASRSNAYLSRCSSLSLFTDTLDKYILKRSDLSYIAICISFGSRFFRCSLLLYLSISFHFVRYSVFMVHHFCFLYVKASGHPFRILPLVTRRDPLAGGFLMTMVRHKRVELLSVV